ncbi:hypothetical protein NQD34_015857 [Periophthalmus magnuspinnatus]|nr:hypothetical protein NQD34_015857 [Periophthalmus magnuspinnatus]
MRALIESMQTRDSDQRAAQRDVVSVCEDDALSVAASDTHFHDTDPHTGDGLDACSDISELSSHNSTCSQGGDDDSAASSLRVAFARLQLEAPTAQPMASSAFFRRQSSASSFLVPPSTEYIKELHACWSDTKAFSKPTSDGRVLAAMQEAPKFGLGHMPAIEPAVASLIVAPDEALRPNARCPRPQCRVTDELLCKAYDSGARMGRIGNSLSHLLLGLATSLEGSNVDAATQGLVDTSLQAFAFMSRELGRLLSILTQARRQVWLAQSPLTETCRRTLRGLPVVPGELFGEAALEALQRTAQASQTRHQLAGLHRRAPPPIAPGSSTTHQQTYAVPSSPFLAPRRPVTRSGRSQSDRPRASHVPRSSQSGHQPSRPSRGQGGRGGRR